MWEHFSLPLQRCLSHTCFTFRNPTALLRKCIMPTSFFISPPPLPVTCSPETRHRISSFITLTPGTLEWNNKNLISCHCKVKQNFNTFIHPYTICLLHFKCWATANGPYKFLYHQMHLHASRQIQSLLFTLRSVILSWHELEAGNWSPRVILERQVEHT